MQREDPRIFVGVGCVIVRALMCRRLVLSRLKESSIEVDREEEGTLRFIPVDNLRICDDVAQVESSARELLYNYIMVRMKEGRKKKVLTRFPVLSESRQVSSFVRKACFRSERQKVASVAVVQKRIGGVHFRLSQGDRFKKRPVFFVFLSMEVQGCLGTWKTLKRLILSLR